MTWDDPSSQFINQFDRSLVNTTDDDPNIDTTTLQYRIKQWNGYWAPLIVHVMLLVGGTMLGLYKDIDLAVKGYTTFPFLIIGLLIILFPFLLLVQRKLETHKWSSSCLSQTMCSCCTDPDEDFLYEEQDDNIDYTPQPSRIYERLYKYLAFNESQNAQIDESSSFASLPFIFFHIWVGYAAVFFWASLTFELDFSTKQWSIPTFLLLSLTILTSFRGPYLHKLFLIFTSTLFIICMAVFSSKYTHEHGVSIISVCAPLFAFPIVLLLGTIMTWVVTNSKYLGLFMVVLTTLFTLWFLMMLGFLHNHFHPDSAVGFLSFPLSVAMIPAYLIVVASLLSLHIKLTQ